MIKAMSAALFRAAMDGTVVKFIFSFPPSLGIARQIDLGALAAALAGIDVVLALHAEDGIAEAKIVPIGAAAPARIETGAADGRKAGDSK
jgi:hypothetical protein